MKQINELVSTMEVYKACKRFVECMDKINSLKENELIYSRDISELRMIASIPHLIKLEQDLIDSLEELRRSKIYEKTKISVYSD